jgi:GT2 family glycosyltransferase
VEPDRRDQKAEEGCIMACDKVNGIETIPCVSIIILNWNGWEDTIECLESLFENIYKNYNVVLIDNGSKNESANKLMEFCSLHYNSHLKYDYEENIYMDIEYFYGNSYNVDLFFISLKENFGFAEGNNIGIKFALSNLNSKYLLFLNNDTIVDKTFLVELENSINRNSSVGFAGPKVMFYDRKEIIQYTGGGKINFFLGEAPPQNSGKEDNKKYDSSFNIDYVGGACLLCKTNVIKSIGYFDPNYFAYWEEVDLCYRGKKLGFSSFYVPSAKIWHKVSQSAGNYTSKYYITRNSIYFMKKYANLLNGCIFIIYCIGIKFWKELFISIFIKRDKSLFKAYLKGTFDGIVMILK